MRIPTFLFMAACGGAEIGPNCEQYLACVGATTPESLPTYEGAYGLDSACWEDDKSSTSCEDSCYLGLNAYQETYPMEEACWDGSAPSAETAFATHTSWSLEMESEPISCASDTTIERLDLSVLAGEGAAFTAEAEVQWGYAGGSFTAACTLAWGTFDCEPVPDDNPAYANNLVWSLSGTFSQEMITAGATLGVEVYANDQYVCSGTADGSGTISGG